MTMERQVDSTNEPQLEDICRATAVVGIDLQPVFLQVVTNGEELRRRCSLLLASANLVGIKIHLTEQVPEKLGGCDDELLALAPSASRFKKSTFSAFGADGFEESLRVAGIEHLLIAGVETSICVYQTALDARHYGFDVTILTDCVSCRRPSDGEWALKALQDADCHTLAMESVLYSLLGTADNPLFRDFSKLIKKYDT